MPVTFFSEKSPTLASVNWCLIKTFTGGDDSGVAFLSHRLVLFRPRRLLSPPFRQCHRVTTELGQLSAAVIALIHNSFGYILHLNIPLNESINSSSCFALKLDRHHEVEN